MLPVLVLFHLTQLVLVLIWFKTWLLPSPEKKLPNVIRSVESHHWMMFGNSWQASFTVRANTPRSGLNA